jgi:hypothetical protein
MAKSIHKPVPTRTTNRPHFEDLDHRRFEDLALALVYRSARWQSINHIGRTGADRGVDIHGVELLENDKSRRWYVQVKRYKSISARQLHKVVDEAIQKGQVPDVLLAVVACDVSLTATESFEAYATRRGIGHTIIWSGSVIEAQLYAADHDLLFAFFGVSVARTRQDRIAVVRRNIALARRMRKDLRSNRIDHERALNDPSAQFEHDRVIIRSIDDTTYPVASLEPGKISLWFTVRLYDFYHNGIEVVLSANVDAIFGEDGVRWDIVRYNDPRRERYEPARVLEIGRIPFDNIIEYDLDVNEYGHGPHIYCDFANGGEPYEAFVYSTRSIDLGNGHYQPAIRLPNEHRVALPQLKLSPASRLCS